MRPGTVDALRTRISNNGVAQPAVTATVLISDRQVLHAMRGAKGADAGVIKDALNTAPVWMASPQAVVLWDTSNRALLVAKPLGDGRYVKLVLGIHERLQGVRALRREDLPTNRFITAVIVRRENLLERQFQLLEGVL